MYAYQIKYLYDPLLFICLFCCCFKGKRKPCPYNKLHNIGEREYETHLKECKTRLLHVGSSKSNFGTAEALETHIDKASQPYALILNYIFDENNSNNNNNNNNNNNKEKKHFKRTNSDDNESLSHSNNNSNPRHTNSMSSSNAAQSQSRLHRSRSRISSSSTNLLARSTRAFHKPTHNNSLNDVNKQQAQSSSATPQPSCSSAITRNTRKQLPLSNHANSRRPHTARSARSYSYSRESLGGNKHSNFKESMKSAG